MSPRRNFTVICLLGCALASACDDEAAREDQSSGNAGAADGAQQATNDAGGGPGGTDSGSQSTSDAGGQSADSGRSGALDGGRADSGGEPGSDGGGQGMRDAAPAADAGAVSDGALAGAFALTSPALSNMAGCAKEMASACAVFPEKNVSYMQDAASETQNLSPELSWTGAPSGTMSFALVLQDLTNGMAHWVLWNIPGGSAKLAENVPKGSAMPAAPAGSQQCNANFAMGNGYFGPGSRCNVYEFVLYALARPMFSPMPATDAGQVRMQLEALGADILGRASLRGRANYMMMCN